MHGTATSITTLAREAGEPLDVLGAPMIVKRDGAGLFLAENIVPPGYVVPPHVHDADEELFVVLEGRLTLLDGRRAIGIGPGETAIFPRGAVHGFRNDTRAPVRLLVMCTPGIQAGEMFRHLDRAGRAGGGAPLTPEAVAEICAQYGVRFA